MNKLSALMTDKMGKKSQYEEIPGGSDPLSNTNDASGEENADNVKQAESQLRSTTASGMPVSASHLELKQESFVSPDSVGTRRKVSVRAFLKRNVACICATAVLVIVFAVSGEKASKRGVSLAPEDVGTQEGIPFRPCQIYHRDASGGGKKRVRVLQTSLGNPSQQWGEIPCLYHGEGWEAFFGQGRRRKLSGENSVGEDPVEYGVPSAQIMVDFTDGPAHPDREPIMGFGGAFTEAAALNYKSLGENGQKAVMELLFGKDGLGYSLGRVHMNSCDFCVESYAFDTTDGDFDLDNFDSEVLHDVGCGMIDMMLEADVVARNSWPNEEDIGMRIIASPWSPPAWMKAPTPDDKEGSLHAENMTGSAEPTCLREGTGPNSRYAKAWALYFSKFINAYKDLGLHLFGVSVQNEPEFPAPWDACAFNPDTEGEFIAHHLGPVLRESHPEMKLLMFDHNKDHAPHWAMALLDETNPASEYIDGTAVHWYAGGMDRLLDGGVGSPNMHRLLSVLKEKSVKDNHIVLGSEACHCPTTGYAGGDLTVAWARAQRYAHTVLADLAAGSNGWIEWNLILDSVGGPNHLGNLCDAPLLAVPHRALGVTDIPSQLSFEKIGHPFGRVLGDQKTKEELNAVGVPAEYIDVGVVVQPMYYFMGHISRHVRPGSRAVKALVDSSQGGPEARTFRSKGQTVAGGGINDLARVGVEVTAWPCEGSTRQDWKYNDETQLQVFGHDWLGVPTTSCLSKSADKDFGGLLLTKCGSRAGAGTFDLVSTSEDADAESPHARQVNIVLSNGKLDAKYSCLVLQPLRNGGGAYGARGGAQVNIGDCGHKAAIWTFNEKTGEIASGLFQNLGGEVCLTTGWPFLQVGAFDTPNAEESKAVVVLNEAGESANFVLRNGGNVLLTSSIPAHAIQTILFD